MDLAEQVGQAEPVDLVVKVDLVVQVVPVDLAVKVGLVELVVQAVPGVVVDQVAQAGPVVVVV